MINRKSLVAAATALAQSTTGITVATAAETTSTPSTTTSSSSFSSNTKKDVDPKKVAEWIGVGTAAIGAISAAAKLAEQVYDFGY